MTHFLAQLAIANFALALVALVAGDPLGAARLMAVAVAAGVEAEVRLAA